MEALKYQFTVKFTVIQYFQMLFELVSKVLPFYMVSFIITTILSVTVVGELSIIGMITFFIIIFVRLSGYLLIAYFMICLMSSILRTILTHNLTYCFFEDKFTIKGHLFKKESEINYNLVKKVFFLKYSNIFYVKKKGFVWVPKRIFVECSEFGAFFLEKTQNKGVSSP